MNIALVLQHKLLLGIQRLLSSAPAPAEIPAYGSPHAALPLQLKGVTIPGINVAHSTPANGLVTKKVMPLRVLRVVEKGQPRSCTGRLVISGRMADVCAELDRLVAREAALH
jgi:hypothetical protein